MPRWAWRVPVMPRNVAVLARTAYRANQSVRQMADLSASRHTANLLHISFRIVVFQA